MSRDYRDYPHYLPGAYWSGADAPPKVKKPLLTTLEISTYDFPNEKPTLPQRPTTLPETLLSKIPTDLYANIDRFAVGPVLHPLGKPKMPEIF